MQFMPSIFMALMVSVSFTSVGTEAKIRNQFNRARQTITNARSFLSNGRHTHAAPSGPVPAAPINRPSRLARVADVTSQSAVALTSLGTLFATVTGFGKPDPVIIEQVSLTIIIDFSNIIFLEGFKYNR